MAAIVRQSMSRTLAKDLLTDMLGATNEYYIGIGKSDPFNAGDTVVDPIDGAHDEREFFHSLQSIKKIEGATFVAKRVNWSSGSEYAGWSDAVNSDIVTPWTPWYVMNDAKEVYICLQNGTNLDGTTKQSVIEPNYGVLGIPEADIHLPFTTSDEYVWKFLYSLTPENIYQFLSSNHMPVNEALSIAEGDPVEDLQATVKAAVIDGQIISARVTSAGLDHTSAILLNVHGDGTGAVATATVVGGEITRIIMTSYGSGYTYASIEIIDENATAIGSASPVITPTPGLGFNPINDLKTSSILTNIKPDGTVTDTFVTGITFRQMGLIKNPKQTDGTTPFTATSAKVLPSMTFDSTSPFVVEKLITGSQSGAKAYVNESVGSVVHYHQNTSTGFKPFEENETVTQVGNVQVAAIATGGLTAMNAIDRFSGELLYLENRPRIRRDVEQQEDIKIVITV
jgi:hypothetical protein